MPGRITKSEFSALESIARDPKASKSVDESTMSSLGTRGMVRTKLGKTEVTSRGKMAVQRRSALTRGKR